MHACNKSFFLQIEAKSYRSILALNGELPGKSFFDIINLPVIAADGAVNTLDKLNIKPKAVVGDLDAAKPELLKDIEVIYAPDQNICDFEKSFLYIESQNLLPTIVVGISGGYIDHIINNLSIFLRSGSIFYAPPIVGYLIKEGDARSFSLPINTKISLFGLPHAKISSSGLKWELKDSNLTFPGDNSAFNRTNLDKVSIKVNKGASIVMIYLEKIDDCGTK